MIFGSPTRFGSRVLALPGYTDPVKLADGNRCALSHVTGPDNQNELGSYERRELPYSESGFGCLAYYAALTVRDSSLSACAQAVLAAEVGHVQLAYDYLAETAIIDLHNLHDNVSSGLHIAALAGTWIACVAGFGGMHEHGGDLMFAPRLPDALSSLAFRILWRNNCLAVEVTARDATYRLDSGGPLSLTHHGQRFTRGEDVVTLPVPTIAQPSALKSG